MSEGVLGRGGKINCDSLFDLERTVHLLAETHGLKLEDDRHFGMVEGLPVNRNYRYAYGDIVGKVLAKALSAHLVPAMPSFDARNIPACGAILLAVSCEFEICGFGFVHDMDFHIGQGGLCRIGDPEPEPSVVSAALTCEDTMLTATTPHAPGTSARQNSARIPTRKDNRAESEGKQHTLPLGPRGITEPPVTMSTGEPVKKAFLTLKNGFLSTPADPSCSRRSCRSRARSPGGSSVADTCALASHTVPLILITAVLGNLSYRYGVRVL